MKHTKMCQCHACVVRFAEWMDRYTERVEATKAALKQTPTAAKPVFVRAYWRKQPGFKRGDVALRRAIFDGELEQPARPLKAIKGGKHG